MAEKSTYRYFVEPLTDNTNEMIAEYLTAQEGKTVDREVRSIVVNDKRVDGVYTVTHSFLTKLSRTAHKRSVRVYVQEGEGSIRTYNLFTRMNRPLSRTVAVKDVKEKIAALPPRRT